MVQEDTGGGGWVMKRTYIVTGGGGFIGSHLCERLLEEGARVICVDNFLTGRQENIQHLLREPDFEFIEKDVSQPLEYRGELDGILHFASPASPKDFYTMPVEIMRVGAFGTYYLLELARRKGVLFFLASTSEIYGDPLVHPQKEDYRGNVNPIGPRGVYDEAKRFAEALTAAYHRHYNVPVRIIRIFNTYGPRMRMDDGRVVPTFICQALAGEPLTIYGDGSQTRSFCYVSDLVEGIVRLMRKEYFYPVNLGNPCEVTILEIAKIVCRLVGCEENFSFLPLPEDEPKRRRPDISLAKELLGWEPKVALEEGLKMTIDWYRRKQDAPS